MFHSMQDVMFHDIVYEVDYIIKEYKSTKLRFCLTSSSVIAALLLYACKDEIYRCSVS